MGEFVCRVADARGRISMQVADAASEGEARRRLTDEGFLVYSIQKRGLPGVSWRWRGMRKRRLRAGDLQLFNQQFMTLIRAGLPILQALDLLAERSTRPVLRGLLDDVRGRVRGGESLSDAFRATGQFPEVYNSAVLAGERSGNLVGVLEQYIAYSKISGTVRRRVIAALIYPALLMVVAAGILSYVTIHVIPRFSELYSEMHVPLPPLTVAVVNFALHLRASVLFLALGAAVLVTAVLLVRGTDAGALALDRGLMKLPLVGPVLLRFRLAQYCRTLSTLLSGGIPLVTAMEVSAGTLSSAVLRSVMDSASKRVSEGQSLHATLQATHVVPTLVTEMIEVGEATGALPQMLASVAEFYEEEINTQLTAALALVEPLLLVGMGGIVLILLVALYLPIFSVGAIAH